eukprot:TRINITY_DN11688_c0_g1_i1.p1 TRINITY_DN11688_c0_g1~~TRINITY_DN11688_c0_g1_i1.p1  ORF type:complete len:130 (+),score=35.15 TRINITY_DN11688_c0_g1_i1:64-453(+)
MDAHPPAASHRVVPPLLTAAGIVTMYWQLCGGLELETGMPTRRGAQTIASVLFAALVFGFAAHLQRSGSRRELPLPAFCGFAKGDWVFPAAVAAGLLVGLVLSVGFCGVMGIWMRRCLDGLEGSGAKGG